MQELIEQALAEDLGAWGLGPGASGDGASGDLTSSAVVDRGTTARALIDQRDAGVIAGLAVAEAVFRRVDPGLRWHALVVEGAWRESGPVAEIAGAARSVLAGERVALNFLQRLSGVATLTARFAAAVEGTGVRILDTRKTTPGLRALEREAVLAGGGHSQRAGLSDAIHVKENHVATCARAGQRRPGSPRLKPASATATPAITPASR